MNVFFCLILKSWQTTFCVSNREKDSFFVLLEKFCHCMPFWVTRFLVSCKVYFIVKPKLNLNFASEIQVVRFSIRLHTATFATVGKEISFDPSQPINHWFPWLVRSAANTVCYEFECYQLLLEYRIRNRPVQKVAWRWNDWIAQKDRESVIVKRQKHKRW